VLPALPHHLPFRLGCLRPSSQELCQASRKFRLLLALLSPPTDTNFAINNLIYADVHVHVHVHVHIHADIDIDINILLVVERIQHGIDTLSPLRVVCQ
jgi:hypothetical protein